MSSSRTRSTARVLVTQLVNKVLLRGKRSLAEKIVYDAMKIVEEKTGAEPLATVKRAVENVKPPLEVRSRRVGGATYQVPVEVRPRRANTLAIRWIVGFARARREKTMAERLAGELHGRRQRPRRLDQAARRPAEDGRVQQGLRPLPLVSRWRGRRRRPGATSLPRRRSADRAAHVARVRPGTVPGR